MEINKIYIKEKAYPPLLREIANPPQLLYYSGELALAQKKCVALVGSRNTTQYGRRNAWALGKRLAENDVVVVSGMAKGIDSCAHQGALEAGKIGEQGKTIAVLGCGADICYPASNRKLRDSIASSGLILSEYPPGTPPAKYRFPQRNRIISGISEITVVVQAPNSSGALITAEAAAEQGRGVYAIPGNIDSPYNLGSNKLLRDGAIPLVVLEELLDDLGLQKRVHETIEKELGREEAVLVSILKREGEMTTDELCRRTGKPAEFINGMLTVLEIKGVICTSMGKIFVAK
ncbi:MAG: DNA-protecting protein DprA [Firmicutes bacterium]|nr:DNA-protecting protein DprA [Bacillota bacterium]